MHARDFRFTSRSACTHEYAPQISHMKFQFPDDAILHILNGNMLFFLQVMFLKLLAHFENEVLTKISVKTIIENC